MTELDIQMLSEKIKSEALKKAKEELDSMTVEDLKNFFFDRRVDELVSEHSLIGVYDYFYRKGIEL